MARDYSDRITLNPPFGYPVAGTALNVYAVPNDPNGVLSGNAGDRAYQTGSDNEWICQGGAVWVTAASLVPTGPRLQFLLQPSLPPDPANGRFDTFAAAHAAAVAVDAPLKTIFVQGDGAPVPIEAGVYDMATIALVGLPGPTPTGQQTMTSAPGTSVTSFVNFQHGTENIILDHLGTTLPLAVVVSAPGAVYSMRTGKNATWQSSGGAQAVLGVTGVVFLTIEDGTSIVGDVPGQFDPFVFMVDLSILRLLMYDNVTLTNNVLRGGAGAVVEAFFVGVGTTLSTTQANYSGVIGQFEGASTMFYSPGAPAVWVPPVPDNIGSALDRLAAALAPLVGGAIP